MWLFNKATFARAGGQGIRAQFAPLFLVFVFVAIWSGANTQLIMAAERPNILFLFADDMAFDAVQSLGWEEVQTPSLDALAESGVVFTHAYNQGGWHGALCVASRTMLLTGRTMWRALQDEPELTAKYVVPRRSWAQRLHDAGYRTYVSGKWHVKTPLGDVFDEVGNHHPGGMPATVAEAYDRPRDDRPDPWSPYDRSVGGFWEGGTHWSEVVANDVIEFIDDAGERQKPFFIYAAFNAPHDPRQAPKEYVDRYPPEAMDVPRSFQPLHPDLEKIGCERTLRDERLAPFPRTPRSVQVHRAEYAAIITHLDAQIGRILTALKEAGRDGDTYVVFTADHGLAVGRHGLLGKQNMYDHSVRVPFMMRGPDLPAGKRLSSPIYLQDVVPTTLEWGGADVRDIEFRSLLPLVDAEGASSEQERELIYGGYRNLQRMVTRGPWKLIVYPEVPRVQLFHVGNDPEELQDLSQRAEHQEKVRQLWADLRSLQAELEDPLVLDEMPPGS